MGSGGFEGFGGNADAWLPHVKEDDPPKVVSTALKTRKDNITVKGFFFTVFMHDLRGKARREEATWPAGPYDRSVFLCFKNADAWLPHVKEDDPPKVVSTALKTRKDNITVKNMAGRCLSVLEIWVENDHVARSRMPSQPGTAVAAVQSNLQGQAPSHALLVYVHTFLYHKA
ncbi:hypothetical protein NC652_034672 [Populus alba x Populus x berolinensis]|nr:hypothetical protein NC652_034672 [Populus alba x Populus x berolinensis]